MDALKKFLVPVLVLWAVLAVLDWLGVTGWFLLPYTGFKNRNDTTFQALNGNPQTPAGSVAG